jgi:3-oxoacyl-(acyl-carrier-protein) synthase
MQAVALLETMRDGVLPGIPQLEEIEEHFPLEMIRPNSREEDVINGLINSIGLDGHCCSLILSRGEA